MPPKMFDRPKITYPPNCKELSEELGKDELIKRLKLLARAFQDMGQEENNEFKELALYLASEFFMEHQSKDVKLLIACCIADIFRIFAPEAPYSDGDQLKEIFLFLTHQLKGLDEPEAPAFKRYFYLLENLAWVKSFNICLELEDNQEIFCALYRLMFSIVSDKHSNKVINFMLDMMSPLISEADAVSQELLDIILINIVEPQKSRNKYTYNLAKDLIRRTANAIEPYIQTFFNNALMLGKTSESDISDRLYDLIYELHGIAPNVLLAVLPQLEFKLKSGDESERKQVTKLLAKMFSAPGSDLALQHKPLWLCFMGRFNDIDIQVRRICVQAAQEFIVNQPDLISDLIEPLSQRQHDPDENVRMDVVQSIVQAARTDFTNVTDDLLTCVKERTLDKKFKIRKEALNGLGIVYKRGMATDDPKEQNRVAWIRNKVLHAYYQQSIDDKVLVERILNTSLVPYALEPEQRMNRLLVLYANLDDHAVKALQELFRSQLNIRLTVRSLLDLHTKGEGDELRQMIIAKVNQLSKALPEPTKAAEYMKKFNKIVKEDQRIRTHLQRLVGVDCPCKKAEDSVKEILKKMGNPIPQNYMYSNVKMLLERIAPVMIDNLAIEGYLGVLDKVIENDEEITRALPEEAVEKAMKLLKLLSHVYPGSFQTEAIYTHLMDLVKSKDETVSDITMQIFSFAGRNLENRHPELHKTLLPVLDKMVKIGNLKQAKHAVKCIDIMYKDKTTIFESIFEHLKDHMDRDSPNFLTALVAVGHIAQICPTEFSQPVKNIVSKFIVKELLMKDQGTCPESMESWYSDHLVSEETQAKVEALKMMVRWLMGVRSKTDNFASSTLRLLHTFVLHEGDLMEQHKMNKAEMARMRLQAGCSMLKLAQEPCYEAIITLEMFQTLALLLNDPCYQVRVIFSQKLHKGLLSLKLPLQYLSIFCLAANDPIKERRSQVKQMLQSNISKRRDFLKTNTSTSARIFSILPDYVLPYAIHLLAHDPDLRSNLDTETLKNIKECLWFIMEPLITKNDNYSYSFYKKIIENIKQTKDAQNTESREGNEKMYAICDLALNLVLTKTSNFILKDFPAEPMLPGKLFTDPDPTYSNVKSYLPQELMIGVKNKKNIPNILPQQQAKSVTDKKVNGSLAQQQTEQKGEMSSTASSPSSSVQSASISGSGRGRGPVSPNIQSQVSPSSSASSRTSQGKVVAARPQGRGRPPANLVKNKSQLSPHRPGVFELVTSPMKAPARPASSGVVKKVNPTDTKVKPAQGRITDFIKKTPKVVPAAKATNIPAGDPERAPRPRGRPPKNKAKEGAGPAAKRPALAKLPPPADKMGTSLRKRAASSSAEPSPVKRPRGRPPADETRKARAAIAASSPGSVSPPSSSPSKSSTASSPPKKRLPGKAASDGKKSYPIRTNVRRGNAVYNGTSSGEDGSPGKRPQRKTASKSVKEASKSGTRSQQKVATRGKR